MIKELKQWGNGLAIYFDTDEISRFGMKKGDKIDLSDMFLIDVQSLKEKGTYKKLPKNQTIKDIKEVIKNG